MARITITVPEALLQRLQPVKERINVSAVCAAAITNAIDSEEKRIIEAVEQLTPLYKAIQQARFTEDLLGTESAEQTEEKGEAEA